MIFVTVGTQLPFDRLIRAIDNANKNGQLHIIAQIGNAAFVPKNIEWRPSFSAAQYDDLVSRCELVVSHAGVGSIIAAQKKSKPIVLFPRRFQLAEHRNDHQRATCDHLRGAAGIYIAETEDKLVEYLSGIPLVPASRDAHADRTIAMIRRLSTYFDSIGAAKRRE